MDLNDKPVSPGGDGRQAHPLHHPGLTTGVGGVHHNGKVALLIGGSLAMALKGFEDYEIVGAARRQATVDYANAHGAVILYDSAYEAFITQPDIPHSIFEIEGRRL